MTETSEREKWGPLPFPRVRADDPEGHGWLDGIEGLPSREDQWEGDDREIYRIGYRCGLEREEEGDEP